MTELLGPYRDRFDPARVAHEVTAVQRSLDPFAVMGVERAEACASGEVRESSEIRHAIA